jgi:hypothetical protein
VNGVVGDILPLAIAVTISPLPIVAEILLLFTAKPVPNAATYLVGFVVGVAVVLGVLVAAAGAFNLTAGSGPSEGASAIKVVLGLLLLVAAHRQLRRRPDAEQESTMPKWMDGISGFAPPKSFALGAVIGAANPKNLAVGLAAALTIAAASLSTGQQAGAIAVYVFVAALGVATPLAALLILGSRSEPMLERWRSWLAQNNSTVMAVLFFVFAFVLIGKGIGGL